MNNQMHTETALSSASLLVERQAVRRMLSARPPNSAAANKPPNC